jgi:thiol-disulfide isomerase/thioredoxin
MRLLLTRALPAAVIVVAAGLGGFLAYGHFVRPVALMGAPPPRSAQAPDAPAGQETDHRAAPTTVAETGAPQRAIPATLPSIAFTDQLGVERRLSDWKGHPLLVNFWASWCEPCREEIPLLERLSRERAQQGFEVIGVAVDSRAAALAYARQAGIRYPLLIGETPGLQAVQALGMQTVFPFSVFVDARGRIVTLKLGKLQADQATLILDRVADLDRNRIDLATARREIADGMAKLALERAHTAASTSF